MKISSIDFVIGVANLKQLPKKIIQKLFFLADRMLENPLC